MILEKKKSPLSMIMDKKLLRVPSQQKKYSLHDLGKIKMYSFQDLGEKLLRTRSKILDKKYLFIKEPYFLLITITITVRTTVIR